MFKRKITESMRMWKDDPNHKCLVIRGARRVGKTFAIKDFIEHNYESYYIIDFAKDLEIHSQFKGNLDVDTILTGIRSIRMDFNPIPGKTVLFFDEIQSCSRARMSLKYFFEDGRFDVIASGSLLGLEYSDAKDESDKDERIDNPVGYERIIDMRSMDFEEYLWAIGISEKVIDIVRGHIRDRTSIDPGLLDSIDRIYREYMAIGGMPQVVSQYLSGGYGAARAEQMDILAEYRGDIGKYTKPAMRNRVNACFEHIPQQLAQTDKKFVFKDVEADYPGNSRFYAGSLRWLIDAGIITCCYNVTEPVNPLNERVKRNYFKVYMNDTGLLMAMYPEDVVRQFLNGDVRVNAGALTENAVMEALSKAGPVPNYFANKTLEIDFILPMGWDIAAIEVKSGNNRKSKTLDSISNKWTIGRLIKFENTNIEVDGKGVEHYPLFAACFVKEIRGPGIEVTPVDVDTVNSLYG